MKPIFRYSDWVNITKKMDHYYWGIAFVQRWWRRRKVQLEEKRQALKEIEERQVQQAKEGLSEMGDLEERSAESGEERDQVPDL